MDLNDLIKPNAPPAEVSIDLFTYALNVLPPVYGSNCFGMGEVYTHRADGTPEYFWFAHQGDHYFGFLGTRNEAEIWFSKKLTRSITLITGECRDDWRWSNDEPEITLTGPNAWSLANDEILRYAAQIRPNLGCWKTDFHIIWFDGEDWIGTLELKNPAHTKPDEDSDADVAKHVREFAEFYVGRFRPAHLTQKQYKRVIADVDEETHNELTKMLDCYHIGEPSLSTPELIPAQSAPLPITAGERL